MLHGLAGRRLRDIVLDRPSRETRRAHHITVDFEGFELHLSISYRRLLDGMTSIFIEKTNSSQARSIEKIIVAMPVVVSQGVVA